MHFPSRLLFLGMFKAFPWKNSMSLRRLRIHYQTLWENSTKSMLWNFPAQAAVGKIPLKHIQGYDFLLQHSLTSFCEAQQVIVQYIDPLIFLATNVTQSILKIPSKVNFCVYVSLIYRDKGINIVIVTSINS